MGNGLSRRDRRGLRLRVRLKSPDVEDFGDGCCLPIATRSILFPTSYRDGVLGIFSCRRDRVRVRCDWGSIVLGPFAAVSVAALSSVGQQRVLQDGKRVLPFAIMLIAGICLLLVGSLGFFWHLFGGFDDLPVISRALEMREH